MKKAAFLIILMAFLSSTSVAQSNLSTLKLLNGDELNVMDYRLDTSKSVFYYKLQRPSGKIKYKSVLIDEVFAYTDSTGEENVFYMPSDENDLSVEQMRHVVRGNGTARDEHQALWAMAGGFAVGTGAMFTSKNPIFSPVLPVAYVGGVALVRPSRDRIVYQYPQYADNEKFIRAYQQSARNKNMKYAIIGSIEGVVVGAIVGILTGYYN
jgi:hypothetical protein